MSPKEIEPTPDDCGYIYVEAFDGDGFRLRPGGLDAFDPSYVRITFPDGSQEVVRRGLSRALFNARVVRATGGLYDPGRRPSY